MLKTQRLNFCTSPIELARILIASIEGDVLFFDSQATEDPHARWSMLMWGARRWLEESPAGSGQIWERPTGQRVPDPLLWMREAHARYATAPQLDADLPFAGGLAGFWSYECGAYLDDLRAELPRDDSPLLWVGEFEGALIFDHREEAWWLRGLASWVEDASAVMSNVTLAPEPLRDLASNAGSPPVLTEVQGDHYQRGVRAGIEAIFAGDLFEVNYSERWSANWEAGAWELYRRLRAAAPGPFGGFLRTQGAAIASVSPEQFIEVSAERVARTRPIKGTRPRGATAHEDARHAAELEASAKDRAENVMIVDLMRNDLTRVCVPGSVEVTELCGLHSFASVHHLISTVEGELAEQADALDAFAASFPAGSITGAPRLRAMEWISENEGSARGPYTGSMFYWSGEGRFDSNVLIRTATLVGNQVRYGSGGAVVSDSDPAGEWEEARWKARPFFDAIGEGASPIKAAFVKGAAQSEEVDDG